MSKRTILRISGSDARKFLQNLVSNDVKKLTGMVYAALLTPQGKYLSRFLFGSPDGNDILIDVAAPLAGPDETPKRCINCGPMSRLRQPMSDVSCGRGPMQAGAFVDPRHADLGWRVYGH